ncbi:zinc finger protein 397-like [Notechis scutatus]|uniref:Zinc finger protein 397-like n=1 Tax=Notechis scutatus TaxID=8663 RepID=A0A6J1VIZ0_9SAUR|nr:zinc finger protein 397-like [Notechis scutatus]
MENSQRGETVLEETPRTLADNSQWTFPVTSNIHGLRWEFQVDKMPAKGKNEWCDVSDDLTTAVEKNPTAQAERGKALPPKQGRKCCYKPGFVEMHGKPCPCPSLEETIQQKCYLDKPQRTHSAEQEAEPLEVRKDFHLGDDLTGCPKNHPSEEPRECLKEEKDSKSQKAVKRDQGIQTEGRRYRCAQCGKSFRHRQTLTKHQKIHTGEKLHECLACGKSFTSREPLLRHQRIHTGEKPYECPQCGKCFRQRVHLMGHQKTHTGEKPFKCPECGRNFSRRDKLTRHQRIHRCQRTYAHPELGKSFDPKAALLKHPNLYEGQ